MKIALIILAVIAATIGTMGLILEIIRGKRKIKEIKTKWTTGE